MTKHFTWLVLLCIVSSVAALAFTSQERADAMVTLLEDYGQVEALTTVCNAKYVATKEASLKAFNAWIPRNGLADFPRVLQAYAAKNQQIATLMPQFKAALIKQIEARLGNKLEGICADLSSYLQQPAQNMVKTQRVKELLVLAEMARELDTSATPSVPSSKPTLNIGNSPLPLAGRYTCQSKSIEFTNWAKDPNNPQVRVFRTFQFDLFANGQYSVSVDSTPPDFWVKYSFTDAVDFPDHLGFYRMRDGRLDWLSGRFASDYRFIATVTAGHHKNELLTGSFNSQKNTIILEWDDNGFTYDLTDCTRMGNTKYPSPTQLMAQAENPETYLKPKNVKANTPRGTGGLNGFYLGEGYQGSRRPAYFGTDGLKSKSAYRWGFENFDCQRVPIKLATTPLASTLCESYSVKGNAIIMSNESERFQKNKDGSVEIGDQNYKPVPPNPKEPFNAKLKYLSSSTNGTTGSYSEDTLILSSNGTFSISSRSGGASYFSIAGTDYSVTSSSNNGTDGTYTLLPYSIELKFTNTLKLRYTFFRDVHLDGTKYQGAYVFITQSYLPVK